MGRCTLLAWSLWGKANMHNLSLSFLCLHSLLACYQNLILWVYTYFDFVLFDIFRFFLQQVVCLLLSTFSLLGILSWALPSGLLIGSCITINKSLYSQLDTTSLEGGSKASEWNNSTIQTLVWWYLMFTQHYVSFLVMFFQHDVIFCHHCTL